VLEFELLMSPDLKLIIQLQDIDGRIRELQREIATLPKHISHIEKALDSHLRKLEADRAALAANQRERKNLDGEIQAQEQKTSKLKDQLMEAKTNDQYRAFQKEIDYCQKEIRRSEDRILALMEESEPLQQNVKVAEAALGEEQRKVEEEKQAARSRTAEDQQALEALQQERKLAVEGVAPTLYSAYERIRSKRGGLAVAEAIEGRCSACHLALRPQFFQDLRRNVEVMFCESCGRILFYNPPVSFDDMAATQADAARP
jgi:predicted  nucleic acid-binding Zn-ribbon protein